MHRFAFALVALTAYACTDTAALQASCERAVATADSCLTDIGGDYENPVDDGTCTALSVAATATQAPQSLVDDAEDAVNCAEEVFSAADCSDPVEVDKAIDDAEVCLESIAFDYESYLPN